MSKQKVQIKNNVADGVPELMILGDICMYDAYNISESIGGLYKNVSNGSKKLRIRINSFGGSVRDALTIISAMNGFYRSGGEIETINEGCADSAAGWIFSFGTRGKRRIMPYASMFFHPPLLGDGTTITDLPENDPIRKELEGYFDILIDIFVAGTGLERTTIRTIMENETELKSDSIISNGFADIKEVLNNMPNIENLSRKEIVNTTSEFMKNYKPDSGKTKNKVNMPKLADLLNLNSECSESAIEKAVQNLINDKNKFESDLTAANEKVTALEAENKKYKEDLENAKNQEILDYVEKLIENDKTKKDNKESLINLAKSDFETFKNLCPLTPVKNKGANIEDGIEEEGQEDGIKDAKEYQNLSQSEKIDLKNKDLAKYKRLANNYEKYYDKIQ